jgi:D-hexose-6-phosphate mutarotase
VAKVLVDLRDKDLFDLKRLWRNEYYYVRTRFSEKPLFNIERSVAGMFSIKCYGCHINGYVKKDKQYYLWIAKRSKTKQTYPSMFDNFVRFIINGNK